MKLDSNIGRINLKYRNKLFQLVEEWKQDMVDIYTTAPGQQGLDTVIFMVGLGQMLLQTCNDVKELAKEIDRTPPPQQENLQNRNKK